MNACSRPLCKNKFALHDTSRWENLLDDPADPGKRFWLEVTVEIHLTGFCFYDFGS